MKTLKRTLGLLLAVCVLAMSLPLSALAAAPAYSDTEGHWAEEVIEKWSEYDVVHGDDGKFRPNAVMTRGEFATVMSNLLGLEEKSENSFRDITGKEWYADAVLKANAAGILLGDGRGNSNATAKIQRQEAFVMVGRALGVVPETNAAGALAGFADKGKVSGWAQPMVAALVKGGYVNGTTDTTLAPGANINRASVIQLVGSTVKTYITKPGSYAADKDGFVVVKTPGSVFVSGDNAGVVVGAGSKGATVTVSSAQIKDGAKVDAPNAVVTLDNTNIGGVVTVSPSAKNAEIVVPAGSTVEKIVTQADSVTVSGDGEVKAVEVASGDKVNVSTSGTTVTVDKDAGSNITAGGQPVKPGESATTPGSGQGSEDEGGGSTVPVTPKYTIQYYVNGTLKETKTVTKSDTAVLPALTAPTVPGYTFTNTWYLDETCNTTPCDASKPIKELLGESSGTTLKLYSKGTPITYTVAFDGNGATSGSVASMNVAYNTADVLPANGFTKTGYTFAGWNTKADGAGTSYAAGDPAKELATTDGATVTLYAQWQGNPYTVTYKANGGEGPDVTVSFTYGDDGVTITQSDDCPFTRTGYNFVKWNTAADGSGTDKAGGAVYSDAANLTLYAQWSVQQFAVSFEANGGTPVPDAVDVNYGETVTEPNPAPTKTGYDLMGWYTDEECTEENKWTFATDTVTGATTLYAKWEPKKFAVTFDVQGGEQVDDTAYQQVPYDTTIQAPTAPTKEGYTFKGWYKDNGYAAPWNFATDKVTGATTLYAKWEIKKFAVTYNGNGNTGGTVPAAETWTYGTTALTVAQPGDLAKTGYNFNGWNTADNGTGTDYAADDSLGTLSADITLYAKWEPKQFTVTYHENGGTGTVPEVRTWTWGTDPITAADPTELTNTGHRFDSWNTQADGAGTSYAVGDEIALTANLDLYAQWIDTTQPGEITFNANGGSGTMEKQEYAADAPSIDLTANSFTREGYHFTHWTRSADGTGTRYEDGATVTGNPGTITLYAQWAMDVTLRLGDYGGEKSIAGEWISRVQENSMLSLETAGSPDLTYQAAGTAKFMSWYQNYFANMEGEKYSKDNAADLGDGQMDCSGNFLVFDIVLESADKYQAGTTTVSVKSDNAEIVATDKVEFAPDENNEGKQTATVAVKLDDARKTSGIQVVIDWDGGGDEAPVTYNLKVEDVAFQPAPIVLGQTVTAYTDLANDNTVVGKTSGGVDLKPADLLKSISMEDYGETIKAALKYVKDTAADEGPGYYLTFQVNSPEMNTQPNGTVKLFFNWDWENDKMPDDERPEGNVHYPDLVLTGSDFVKNGTKYTATVAYKMDPSTYVPGRGLMMSATWMDDNTWNEAQRGFGANLQFVPQNNTVLMLTRDANENGTNHWPFLFGATSNEDGGHTAQDLFVDGPDELAEKFKIEKQPDPPVENTTVYNASGYLRFIEYFPGYANDRYPVEAPDQEPGPDWHNVLSGCYVPVDIVNVQGVNADNAEAKVYDGPVSEGGQLIYTITDFTKTVQQESGAGYPDSATLIQRVPDDLDSLFIVVDWNTQDDTDTVETLVLNLGSATCQKGSRVRITTNNQHETVTYGQELRVTEDNGMVGTLIHTEPKDPSHSGYYLPLTFAPMNMGAELDTTAGWVLEYRFTTGSAESVVLPGSSFTNNKSCTVLLPVPQEVVDNPGGKGLQIDADWDGKDYIPENPDNPEGPLMPNTGHMDHGPSGMWLNLEGLRFQSQYHLVSAHDAADETRLETVPAASQTYQYNYVQRPDESDPGQPTAAEATVTLREDTYEYGGRTAGELVGGDFRITSEDGSTYYALGMVKYTELFNSYWFNHARDTFFYIGRTEGFPEEHYAKQELAGAGLLVEGDEQANRMALRKWIDGDENDPPHSNAASFGYYMVFDLEKGELQDGGRIEIHDPAAGEGAVRTINAADFGDGDKLPVVYQLKLKEGETQPGDTSFANEISIKYFNTASTADPVVITLALEKAAGEGSSKENLYSQPVSEVRWRQLAADNATQMGMELRPSRGPGDVMDPARNFDLFGGIFKADPTDPNSTFNLTLNFAALAPENWPMIWDPNANEGAGDSVPTPNDTVVVRINLDTKDENGAQRQPIEITKGDLNNPCVIENVDQLGGLNIDVNWAGFDTGDWAGRFAYIGLWRLAYQDTVPTYNQNELGTIVKSKDVIATTETVTVGGTAIGDDGATGTPNAFGIVNVTTAYDGLYPKMTDLGETVGHFGAFTLKAPENATAYYAALRPDMTPFEIMNDFPQWAQEAQTNGWCSPLQLLWCSGAETDTRGVQFAQLPLEAHNITVAVQWYNGNDPLGSPVYYALTFEHQNDKLSETESPMRLLTAPNLAEGNDENQAAETKYQTVLDNKGTWLYLEGSYDASAKTWTPENWQPLKLVSGAGHAEGYYVELELLAPQAVAESSVSGETVLCTVSGGSLGSETIELKGSDLKNAHMWDTPVAWLEVVVPVAANTAVAGTDHGGEVTFTVDWDGAGDAYTATTYKLNLDKVALSNEPITPAP